jgi:hypothetical protein
MIPHTLPRSRPVTHQTRPLSDASSPSAFFGNSLLAWSHLVESVREFGRICLVDETHPELLWSLLTTDSALRAFAQRAKLLVGGSLASGRSMGIRPVADAFLDEFRRFVGRFASVLDQNLAPLHAHLSARVTALVGMVRALSHLYDRPHPILATATMRPTQSFVASLCADAVRFKQELAHSTVSDFQVISFEQRLKAFTETVHMLFPNVFPNNSITIGNVIEAKRDLFVTFELAFAACHGMRAFDRLVSGVTDAIFAAGQAIERLFKLIGLNCRFLNEADDDQPIEEGEEKEPLPTVAGVIEHCSRIQKRLMRITSLAEPPPPEEIAGSANAE